MFCLGGCVLQRCGGFASRCVKCNRLPAFTSTAYKEKVKEISVLSLICSCLYPETRKNIMGDFEGQTLNCSSYITKKNWHKKKKAIIFQPFILFFSVSYTQTWTSSPSTNVPQARPLRSSWSRPPPCLMPPTASPTPQRGTCPWRTSRRNWMQLKTGGE